MFHTKVAMQSNIHFEFNNFFPENRAVYEMMWKNTVEMDRPQMTIWRMRIACWMPKGYKHTLRVCNSYCFSTATTVARKHLNVTLYVQCLSSVV